MQLTEDKATPTILLANAASDDSGEDVYVFATTLAQRRFWMLDRLKPGNPALNFALSARLQGRVDRAALQQAIHEIVQRHEILRTSFRTEGGEVVQVVHSQFSTGLDWHDVSGLAEQEREAEVEKLRREEAVRSFSLTEGRPLLRAGLIKVKEDDYVLNLSMHHIACDGWSNGVLIPELAKIYTALVTGQPGLPELPLQYGDFAQWQNEWLASPDAERERAFWLSQLDGILPTLNLPTDRPRRAGRTHPGTIHTLLLSKSLTDPLKEMCIREEITLFMLIIATYGALLYRYTGNPDVIIGSPAANRNQTNLEGLIGLFTNPLLMRLDYSGNPTMLTLLARVKAVSMNAFSNHSYPFEKLAEEIQTDPHRSGVQWLQAYFVFQKAFMLPQQMPDLTLTPLRSLSPGAMFEWLLGVLERAEGVRLQLEYNTDLYDHSTIDRMLHHFQRALETILVNPNVRVDQLPILTPGERQLLIVDWNATKGEVQSNRRAHELFEDQVLKAPDAEAVCDGATQVSYSELNARANRLAHYLRGVGVKAESRIGLALDPRSMEFVIGWLGVLKAGGCGVLLDRRKGDEALAKLIQQSGLNLLLTDSSLPPALGQNALRVVCLDTDANLIAQQPGHNVANAQLEEREAMVRFSSGRGGSPRGCVFSHQALVHGALVAIHELGLSRQDRVGGDINEILPALLAGATIVLPPRAPRFNAGVWLEWALQQRITVAALPTSCWHECVRHCSIGGHSFSGSLRLVAVGGDRISSSPLAAWQRLTSGQIRLLDRYLLAETAGAAAYSDPFSGREAPGRVAISRPASDVQIYLLDAHHQPVPIGVPGDVYVGGKYLASGYLDEPAAEANDFMADVLPGQSSAKLLRTGDRGRFLEGGGIEFVGRADELAKTCGFRLELCELRWGLGEHPGVWDALILPGEEAGEKILVAYVVSATQTPLQSTEMGAFLQKQFPAYMLPATVVVLREFPLTPDGQVDRQALTALRLEEKVPGQNGAPAATPTENTLIALWKDVLKARHVGVHDNFFDLGGDSLAAATLQTRIEKETGRRLPLASFFQATTVAQQADLLGEAEEGAGKSRVLTFRPASTGQSLFLFHYLSASQLLASHFPASRLVHCIDSPFEDEFGLWQETGRVEITMQELARRCTEQMRSVQAEGPYCLAGFCYGGVVAFAVAQVLAAQGQSVSFMGLLDAFYLPGIKPVSTPWLRRLVFHARKTLALGAPYVARKLRNRMKLAREREERLKTGAEEKVEPTEAEKTHVRRIAFMREIIAAYRGEPYLSGVTVFRAVADPHPFDFDFAANGWEEIVRGGVRMEDFECSHLDLSEEPGVGDVAKRIEVYLSRLDATQSPSGRLEASVS
jgi:non-ribosomal peptide synthetase component F/thioesterase domain-containing protein/acyl carrier protein